MALCAYDFEVLISANRPDCLVFVQSSLINNENIPGSYMTIIIVTFLAKKINISLNGKNYSHMM